MRKVHRSASVYAIAHAVHEWTNTNVVPLQSEKCTSILKSQISNLKSTMIKYLVKQLKNSKSSVNGMYFAHPFIEETVDLDGLSEHMSNHNSPFSKGVIRGILCDMVSCIKELLLEGKNVKLPDLAIFSIGIKNRPGGAAAPEDFTSSGNILGVKLRARATGELTPKSLDLDATLKKATVVTGNANVTTDGDTNP